MLSDKKTCLYSLSEKFIKLEKEKITKNKLNVNIEVVGTYM